MKYWQKYLWNISWNMMICTEIFALVALHLWKTVLATLLSFRKRLRLVCWLETEAQTMNLNHTKIIFSWKCILVDKQPFSHQSPFDDCFSISLSYFRFNFDKSSAKESFQNPWRYSKHLCFHTISKNTSGFWVDRKTRRRFCNR